MNTADIKQRLYGHHNLGLVSHLLFFDNWKDPADFYTMGLKERKVLMSRYRSVSVEPTDSNQWIWFGSYDIKRNPKFNTVAIATYLHKLVIQPSNDARIRGMLNLTKSDVNPFKYFKAMNMTPLEILNLQSERFDVPMATLMTTRQNDAFESKVVDALKECQEYYMVNSPTEEREFMKQALIQNGHMPLAVDEAMTRSGLAFKD